MKNAARIDQAIKSAQASIDSLDANIEEMRKSRSLFEQMENQMLQLREKLLQLIGVLVLQQLQSDSDQSF